MNYWPNNSPFGFQLMVESPSCTTFFGSRLIVGFGELSVEPSLLLSVFEILNLGTISHEVSLTAAISSSSLCI